MVYVVPQWDTERAEMQCVWYVRKGKAMFYMTPMSKMRTHMSKIVIHMINITADIYSSSPGRAVYLLSTQPAHMDMQSIHPSINLSINQSINQHLTVLTPFSVHLWFLYA